MYVIGVNDFSFLRIKSRILMDCCKFWNEVEKVTYDCDLGKATHFNDYEIAEKIMNEIKTRKNEILFENDGVLEQILDKRKEFNIDKMKIYQLVAIECNNN